MPSATPGRTVVQVKVTKKRVMLLFADGTHLEINPSVYSDFYLYEGKSLTENEFRDIKNHNEIAKLSDYAFGLVASKSYTTKQLADRLYKKKANRAMVEAIIGQLAKNRLLDDKQYVADFLEYAKDRHLGERKIKDELYNDGISEKIINSLSFDDDEEIAKAMELLPNLEKRAAGHSSRDRKQRIYAALANKGFGSDTISHVISHMKESDPEDELSALRGDYEKAARLYQNRFTGEKLRTHLVNNLAQKGYNYNDIKKILEEYKHEMDQ